METNKKKGTAEPKKNGGFERLKRKNSTKLFRQRVFYFILIVVLLIIFVIAAVSIFFRVHAITVKGNTMYADSEIVEASGIEKDMNIYLIDDRSVVTNILSNFPYVRTVKVERNIPSGVTLDMTCDEPRYYFEISGECFVVSSKLRVLEGFASKEELITKHPEIKKLTGGEIKNAIVGSELTFVNSSYTDTARELLGIMEKTEIYEGVSSVDFSDRFNMQVVYDGRLKANIGNSDETELKLRFMNEIVKDLGEARGTIDIKDVEAAYVLLDSNVAFD